MVLRENSEEEKGEKPRTASWPGRVLFPVDKIKLKRSCANWGLQIFQMELGQVFVCCFDRLKGPCPVSCYYLDAWVPAVEGLLTCWGKQNDRTGELWCHPSSHCSSPLWNSSAKMKHLSLHYSAPWWQQLSLGLCWQARDAGFVWPCIFGSFQHHPHQQLWGNVEHIVILNSTVLKCPFNGYNNHLTNNLEQALIACNVVSRLGCGESRDMLAVTAFPWLYGASGSISMEQKGTSLMWIYLFLLFGEPEFVNVLDSLAVRRILSGACKRGWLFRYLVNNKVFDTHRYDNGFSLLTTTAIAGVYDPMLSTSEKVHNCY